MDVVLDVVVPGIYIRQYTYTTSVVYVRIYVFRSIA